MAARAAFRALRTGNPWSLPSSKGEGFPAGSTPAGMLVSGIRSGWRFDHEYTGTIIRSRWSPSPNPIFVPSTARPTD